MQHRSARSVLFLGKRDDPHCDRAADFTRRNFADVSIHMGAWGESLPQQVRAWEGDLILSYLSRWIVPSRVLERAQLAALNFHPAPPDYPGIGCNNFALYERAKEFGVTCHHMAPAVDSGRIVAVRRFPVFNSDDVGSLLARTYDVQLVLFYEIAGLLLRDEPLPAPQEAWTRKPFTRTELNELSRLTPDMTADEISRRVRATSHGKFQPTLRLAGHTFTLSPEM